MELSNNTIHSLRAAPGVINISRDRKKVLYRFEEPCARVVIINRFYRDFINQSSVILYFLD